MVLNAEKHLQVATLYDKLSANEIAAQETRIAFARKANWHRILARMSSETAHLAETEKPLAECSQEQAEALLFSPRRLWEARDKGELRY
jgi:hypothetical protein